MESAALKTEPLTPNTDAPLRRETPLQNTAPGSLKVIKRNGEIALFEYNKIEIALTKAFLAVEGGAAAVSDRVHEKVARFAEQILKTFERRLPTGGSLHIEDVQDQVELTLMRSGEHIVARSYVVYREERRQVREKTPEVKVNAGDIRVTLKDGALQVLDKKRLQTICKEACQGLVDVDAKAIFTDSARNLFDGVKVDDVSKALILSARTLIEKEPNYSYATARLLLDSLRAEALGYLGVAESATFEEMKTLYPKALKAYVEKGIELELLDPKLRQFDLDKLGAAIDNSRDLQFTYLSMQTLYDRYFLHHQGTRFELPQILFMRVAMGLSLEEDKPTERAIEFYNMFSSFNYMSSTPTLFNAGTLRSQLSSCYLSTLSDDLESIYGGIRDNALLQKFAGGIGNDWTPIRSMNSHIKGTNGKSQGVIPFMKVANDTALAVNQGGKRKGAVCGYLETWHLDIEEFLELRKNSGDDRRRTHDMNTANWVPDLFMQRVLEDKDWTLFSPSEAPDLHETFGEAFEKRYTHYEALAAKKEIFHKTVKAKTLWRKMLSMLFETGHPWITFKDVCNIRSPQQHCGVVHSSNLCTEITLNTSKDEIAVCNLGSINLPQHLNEDGSINSKKLRNTVRTAIRMLDNVIDINYYSVPQARKSNLRHRPIGLGLMGFNDALYKQNLAYDSEQAVEFADTSMEEISYYAIEASMELAKERGTYQSFEGSLWSKGVLPIDSISLLQHTRGKHLEQDTSRTLNWNKLRSKVRTVGMRNSNVMAIAPTATISNICGVSQSIEPTYQNLYVKSNMSGDFTVLNEYLVKALKAKNLWDDVMINDLKYFNGSVAQISRVPAEIKRVFSTAFEIEAKWLIDAASRRQKWIDQAQSLNLYLAEPSGKALDSLYKHAWKRGLKTTYYLRSLGATSTEKSTIGRSDLNAVKNDKAPQVCSILDPDCEACQ
jgi:ribonucleoside-diphosphate reductase alpha chain